MDNYWPLNDRPRRIITFADPGSVFPQKIQPLDEFPTPRELSIRERLSFYTGTLEKAASELRNYTPDGFREVLRGLVEMKMASVSEVDPTVILSGAEEGGRAEGERQIEGLRRPLQQRGEGPCVDGQD
jgi:hypothetical protein